MNPAPFNKVKLDPHFIYRFKSNTVLLDLAEVANNQQAYFICYLPKRIIVCYKGWRILSMLEDDHKLLEIEREDKNGAPSYKVLVEIPIGFLASQVELELDNYVIYGSNPICPPF